MFANASIMAMPKFEEIMLPLLSAIRDGGSYRFNDVIPKVADVMHLTEADRAETMKSGQPRFRNRVYWAKLYLSQAGALETPAPGTFRITKRGEELLVKHPAEINEDVLMEYPEFRAFRARSRAKDVTQAADRSFQTHETPQESIQRAYVELKDAVVRELLDAVRAAPPSFLEGLIVRMLTRMGYGEGDESGAVLGGVHDGGVDGVIKKDRLGLSNVYVQAKRYKDGSSVGAPAIQQFAGSMQERRAEEGVFVTTSTFTKDAYESVKRLHARIALIDGQRLAELMFDLGIGVTEESSMILKRIDSDFFTES